MSLNGERKKWHFKGLSEVEIARTQWLRRGQQRRRVLGFMVWIVTQDAEHALKEEMFWRDQSDSF